MSRRRGHGEGSIYERKDGRWAATIDLGWQDGKRKRKTVYGKTRREVADKLRAEQSKVAQGLPLPPETVTVGDHLDHWLMTKKGTVRPRTWEKYEGLVRLHIKPVIGDKRLTKLAPQDLQQLYADRLESGLAPMSVVHIHRVLHTALKDAGRVGLVSRNVAALVSPPRPPQTAMQTLDPDQVNRLLRTAKDDRLQALYVVALTTGMRLGELLGLRWREVHLDAGMLRVQVALQRIGGLGLQITEPKTASSRRQIQLTRTAIDALRQHRVAQAAERLQAGAGWDDQDMVFANTTGGPISPSNLHNRSFKPLLKQAGLPGIRFHDLRHTCATLLLGKGVHPKVVQEMLGHSDVGVTLDLYSHVTPTMQQQAADALDDLLGDTLAVNLAVKDGPE